jgi:uncharacterized protein
MSDVRNNREAGRFELEVDGHLAHADYRQEGEVTVFTHTVVPAALQGQGIGSRLVAGALAQVRAEGGKVRPLCTFVARYIAGHPEWRNLVVE